MARVKTSSLVSEISGSIGGTTYRRDKAGQVMSDRRGPAKRQTAAAQAQRDRMMTTSSLWSGLSKPVREFWRNLAAANGIPAKAAFWATRNWEALTSTLWRWPTVGTNPEAQQWRGVCYAPELGAVVAVAVSGTNRVALSGDCQHWSRFTAAERSYWYGIAWSPSLMMFCAVATSGAHQIMTSHDGEDWTYPADVYASTWISICWSTELGIFCAVAYSGTYSVMTSPDGIHWTASMPTGAIPCWSICWSPQLGLFCAVATSGTDRIMTSPDGTNWTTHAVAAFSEWRCVTWSPQLGLFCAVASAGTNRVMTSPDGTNWTAHAAAAASSWYGVAWSPQLGLFCAVAAAGTHCVMTSPDGANWTAQTVDGTATAYSVTWSAYHAMFVAPCYSGNKMAILSPITIQPTKPDETPLLTDYDISTVTGVPSVPLLTLAAPAPGAWAWTLNGSPPEQTITAVIPAPTQIRGPDIWAQNPDGASEVFTAVWFGHPVNPGQNQYRGKWKLAEVIHTCRGPWATTALPWPWGNPIQAGTRIPIRCQNLSRGMRISPLHETIVTLK